MNRHTRFLLIRLAACGMIAPLRAQESPAKDWPYRVEVFGIFSNGNLYNGDSLWGSGLDYGGGTGQENSILDIECRRSLRKTTVASAAGLSCCSSHAAGSAG